MADEREPTTGRQRQVMRVYVCSAFDMTEEREHLASVVFPHLCELCEERGVDFEAVDLRQGLTSEAEVLHACCDEICRCRPFFIGILGDRYGWIPEAIPEELLQRHDWLRQYPGRSVTELEIRCGALNDPGAAAQARFYFRDPQYLDQMPPDEGQEHAEDDPMKRAKLAALKEEIRRSGLAVRENYRTPQELGEMIVADLTAALNEIYPPAAEPPPYADENVQFTVYRPSAVQPEKWYPLLAFAHLSERRPDAPPDEPDPIEEVRRQAEQILGERAEEYQDLTQDSRQAVPREGELTFVPEVPGVRFNPPRRTFLWLESLHREDFRLRASAELDGQVARGRMSVFLGSFLVAEVSLSIRVDSALQAEPQSAPMEPVAASRFRWIFASYSHKDRRIVEEYERFVETLGDRYLRDCRDLRAGEDWDEALKAMIRKADVFQLFWSWNSMTSPFVRAEWEFALELALSENRSNFIRPTYWQEPLPSLPEQDLPPEALRRVHFQRIAPAAGEPPEQHAPGARPSLGVDTGTTYSTIAGPGAAEGEPRPAERGDDSFDTAFSPEARDQAGPGEVGISLFDEVDLETEPDIGNEISTGEPADDTSLGAEVLDDIDETDAALPELDAPPDMELDDTAVAEEGLGTSAAGEVLDHIDEMEGAVGSGMAAVEEASAEMPLFVEEAFAMRPRRGSLWPLILLILVLAGLLAGIIVLAVKFL